MPDEEPEDLDDSDRLDDSVLLVGVDVFLEPELSTERDVRGGSFRTADPCLSREEFPGFTAGLDRYVEGAVWLCLSVVCILVDGLRCLDSDELLFMLLPLLSFPSACVVRVD